MSKGRPTSLITEISHKCHIYPGDTDVIRLSASRLEAFIKKRDKAISNEIQAIRKEMAEQEPMIKALLKVAKENATNE